MTLLPAPAEAWLATHHGVATTSTLANLGVPRRTASRLVRLGLLHRPTAGVFVLAGSPASLHQRAAVLCATYPSGFVTGPTAGMLAGLRRMPRSSQLHFSLRHGINPEDEPGVWFRQTTQIQPFDRLARPDGIIVASWARLAFDLAADLGRLDHISVINQLLDRRDVTAEELRRIGARLVQPARRGSRRFARTMEEIGSGAPADSHGEVALLDALRQRGVPAITQVPVHTAIGVQHLDLGDPTIRWGVELDVHPEHRSLEGHRRDAERRRATNAADWQVEVVAELDLADAEAVAERLARNHRQRRQRLGLQPSMGR
ncbi:MAG: type IV toxin-antitoxin system AbiEi family antitoxin domain-containing protein [Desertimonas sp.]